MHSSIDTSQKMHNSHVCDGVEYGKSSKKLGMDACEGEFAVEDAHVMQPSARSTNVFSEMPTLESIPDLTDVGPFKDPFIQEIELLHPLQLMHPAPNNDLPARQATFSWRGVTLPSESFNLRKLQMPRKRQNDGFEESTTSIKDDEIDFDARPVQFFLPHTCKQSDEGGDALENREFIDVFAVDEEAGDEVSDAKKVASYDDDLCTATSKQSSAFEYLERSTTMHSMLDNSLAVGSSVMAGLPGRALRKKRGAAQSLSADFTTGC